MRKRESLQRKIKANRQKIKDLYNLNIDLQDQLDTLSDSLYKYKETEVTIGRGENKRTELHGHKHWTQAFTDEDTGDVIWVERRQLVRINSEPVNAWGDVIEKQ